MGCYEINEWAIGEASFVAKRLRERDWGLYRWDRRT